MKCEHYWVKKVSDSAHWEECALCPLQRVFDEHENRYIYFTEEEWDINPDSIQQSDFICNSCSNTSVDSDYCKFCSP